DARAEDREAVTDGGDVARDRVGGREDRGGVRKCHGCSFRCSPAGRPRVLWVVGPGAGPGGDQCSSATDRLRYTAARTTKMYAWSTATKTSNRVIAMPPTSVSAPNAFMAGTASRT